ncbi:hypothetical protein BaRGS_00037965 [Batillaria attramentaria]|uniref:PPM-type phosphatase domain-containing protein n=1 Tax=Batillaria attramentaria TaxID=370345 RepID=A0ABD0J743_9CAEN
MTSHRIGVNLRVSGNCDQGGRKYMEDTHAIKFVKKDTRDYEFAYFGIFDGHGGPEASRFARDNLLDEITKYDQFWSDDDDDILCAIKSGFLDTHQAMWKELDNWPRTVSGLPSTSGTTASIAIIKKSKLYIGHVGDSGIVLGCDEGPRNAVYMKPKCLTKDHKPDNPEERARIEKSGGSVVAKAGVQRVVWSRPKVNHKGPVRRSTQIDKIPFLAVARSLGDLWSYDYYKGQFVVSPEPDVSVMTLEPGRHRCLVLASDGLWNMLSASEAVSVVTDLEMHFEDRVIHDPMVSVSYWINPAERLVTRALNKWRAKSMKADNVSCVVVLIDPLGPSKLTILRKRREEHFRKIHEARKAAVAAKLNNTSSSTSGSSSSNNASSVKVNRNQSNNGSHSDDNEDADENGAQKHLDLENKLQASFSGVGVGMSSSTGLASSDSNHNVNNGSGAHAADDSVLSMHGSKAASKMPPRPASASKIGKTHRPPMYRASSRLSLPTRSTVTNDMDDSVQAASALTVSPCFNLPLSPTLESPLLPSSGAMDGAKGSYTSDTPNLASSFSMSDSLLKLMNLDAVKASSDPVIKPSGHSVTLTSANCASKKSLLTDDGGGEQDRKVRRSSVFSKTVLHTSLQQRPEPLGLNTSRSNDRLSLRLNKTFHSTRVLRLTTTQRGSKQGLDRSSELDTHDRSQTFEDSQPSKVAHISKESSSAKKGKKKREFGLLYRTRSTLLRAKRAARKAFCPENRPFLKQLPGAKRKRDEKHTPPGTPSSKRLRRSDGLRCSF